MRNSVRIEEIARSQDHLCDHCEARPATGINLNDGSYTCPDCCPEQVAQAWDESRGHPWPYRLRPCFAQVDGCTRVATTIYDDMALCKPCEDYVIGEEQKE